MLSGFRVQGVEIEGFKGFTQRREIDFRGRHAFLLGQNGNGKSSIIEAIRWGLFGSTGRPNEVVANQGYAGRCRVTITLVRDGMSWNLRRTLIRGASGGSDAALTDESGTEHSITEVLPKLDSADTGEGTYIIFAPQAVPLRRQPEDLTPFERTVFNHLGLTLPRALLGQMNSFLTDQELSEDDLGSAITDKDTDITRSRQTWIDQRSHIMRSPPWGTEQIPSVVESENRARSLIEEITGKSSDSSLVGLSLDALTDKARAELNNTSTPNQLSQRIAESRQHKERLEKYRTLQRQIETQKGQVNLLTSTLEAILDGSTIEQLRSQIEITRKASDTEAIRSRIIRNTIDLNSRTNDSIVCCPICRSLYDPNQLTTSTLREITQSTEKMLSELSELEQKLDGVEGLQAQISKAQATLRDTRDELDGLIGSIKQSDLDELREHRDPTLIGQMINKYKIQGESTQRQLNDHQNWVRGMGTRLRDLQSERRFHDIQRKLTNIQAKSNQMEQVKQYYDNLVEFGEAVRRIQDNIEASINTRLNERIPKVTEDMSRVFASLTQHPHFDRLTMTRERFPKLELRVTSSNDTTMLTHPTSVLNGQAESALDLVPYFTFGQARDALTEVYLVMLDDPTRAFDEEHTEILVQRLAELGGNVQLMVASQETERFRNLLPDSFKRDEYLIIEPSGWSYAEGPSLSFEYE